MIVQNVGRTILSKLLDVTFNSTLFADTLTISSLVNTSSTVKRITTSTAHGLVTGNVVAVTGVRKTLSITSLTQNLGIACCYIAGGHGLTDNVKTLTVSGSIQGEYNGVKTRILDAKRIKIKQITTSGTTATITFSQQHYFPSSASVRILISGVSNDYFNGVFNYSVVSTTSISITLFATPRPSTIDYEGECSIYLDDSTLLYEIVSTAPAVSIGGVNILNLAEENYGYNGVFVVTVVNTTTFSYTTTDPINTSVSLGSTSFVHKSFRIEGAVNIERYLEIYTKQATNKARMCLVMENESTSSAGSNNIGDANVVISYGSSASITEITNFSVYVLIPTSNTLTAFDQVNNARNVKLAIYKSIANFNLTTTGQTTRIVPLNNDAYLYNVAYYVHRYSFQFTTHVDQDDMYDSTKIYQFKTITLDINSSSSNLLDSTIKINEEFYD